MSTRRKPPLPEHPSLNPPRQARSRETMERVLATFVEMLGELPFDRITIAALAHRAAVSAPSIYARFENKDALLLAAHEQFKAAAEARLDHLLADDALAGRSSDELLAGCADAMLAMYASNARLLRGVLLSDHAQVYERADALARHVRDRVVAALRGRLPGPPAETEQRIDFALRCATALMQQRLLFGSGPGWYATSTDEIRRALRAVFARIDPRADVNARASRSDSSARAAPRGPRAR